jgi:hypothetical protein
MGCLHRCWQAWRSSCHCQHHTSNSTKRTSCFSLKTELLHRTFYIDHTSRLDAPLREARSGEGWQKNKRRQFVQTKERCKEPLKVLINDFAY